MAITDRSLDSEERAEITRFMKMALKQIGADRAAAPDPDKLQTLISRAIDQYRKQDEFRRKASLLDASVSLGSLWGQLICDQIGWTWAFVKMGDGKEYYGVVSPNRSHLIFPIHHIQELLIDPAREQNSLALYHSIKSGALPPSKEREYLVLGSVV